MIHVLFEIKVIIIAIVFKDMKEFLMDIKVFI